MPGVVPPEVGELPRPVLAKRRRCGEVWLRRNPRFAGQHRLRRHSLLIPVSVWAGPNQRTQTKRQSRDVSTKPDSPPPGLPRRSRSPPRSLPPPLRRFRRVATRSAVTMLVVLLVGVSHRRHTTVPIPARFPLRSDRALIHRKRPNLLFPAAGNHG